MAPISATGLTAPVTLEQWVMATSFVPGRRALKMASLVTYPSPSAWTQVTSAPAASTLTSGLASELCSMEVVTT